MTRATFKSCLSFEVPGDAVSFGTKTTRFVRDGRVVAGTRKTSAAADWQAEVRRAAAEAWDGGLMIEGPVSVTVRCYFTLPRSKWRKREPREQEIKTTKPDLDKVLRLVLDALEGVVYANDAQVANVLATKRTAPQGEPALTRVVVSALDYEGVE